jgi:lipopolysaccharide/colanic/teichoic acid biosynthesis glycosyltransferase
MYVGNEMQSLESLQKQPHISLTVVNNNLNAVNLLKTIKKPDAIICDYNLPGNDGLFLFDWLRKQAAYSATPFILFDTEFSSEVFRLAFHKGVDDFYVISDSMPENLFSRMQFLCNFKKNRHNSISQDRTDEVYQMPISKRLFDIFVAFSVLLVASPFLLLIIIAIRLESKGKVYYISKRVGRKMFDFYKFRSMRTGSDELLSKLAKEKNQYNTISKPEINYLGTPCPRCARLTDGETCSPLIYIDNYHVCDYWYNFQKSEFSKNNSTFIKIANDPRITRVGRFIRNTSIDELPQLLNVIKGDMSIVGNRPLPVYEAELLTADSLSKRFLAPAGITGLWQVELRGKGGVMSEEERMQLDNKYADHFTGKNYSMWTDFKIILKTIPALLQKSTV